MNQPIQLIVNADDLGSGSPTDTGIIEAFQNGIVTSASLLANGPSFNSAVKLVHETGLPIGVHLNLSEGRSLTGPIPGLTDEQGSFLGKVSSREQFATGELDTDLIHREFNAQISRVRETGLSPDHLDSHQHCALFPKITAALLTTVKDSGLNRMRLPLPVRPANEDPPPPLGDELQLYRQLSPQLAKQLSTAAILTPDGLLGMPLLNRLDETQLSSLISSLTPGTWELMVHPGYFDPQRAFSGSEREQELTALTSREIQTLIKQQQINLINFTELPCDC